MSNTSQLSAAEHVVRSYLESFEVADVDAIAAHVSSDFVNEHTAALGSGCVGRAAYRERLPGFLGDMVGLTYEPEDIIAQVRDQSTVTVAAFYVLRASWQATTSVVIRGVQRLVVSDGLITHRTDYWDSANFLLQASPEAAAALAPFGISAGR